MASSALNTIEKNSPALYREIKMSNLLLFLPAALVQLLITVYSAVRGDGARAIAATLATCVSVTTIVLCIAQLNIGEYAYGNHFDAQAYMMILTGFLGYPLLVNRVKEAQIDPDIELSDS